LKTQKTGLSTTALYKILLKLIQLRSGSVCKHFVGLEILNAMELEGIKFPPALAASLSQSGEGDPESERLLLDLLGQKPKVAPTKRREFPRGECVRIKLNPEIRMTENPCAEVFRAAGDGCIGYVAKPKKGQPSVGVAVQIPGMSHPVPYDPSELSPIVAPDKILAEKFTIGQQLWLTANAGMKGLGQRKLLKITPTLATFESPNGDEVFAPLIGVCAEEAGEGVRLLDPIGRLLAEYQPVAA